MIEFGRDPIINEVKEKLKSLDVEAVLFDLDDTLIYTGEIFAYYMEEYSEVVSERIGVSRAEVRSVLQELNDEEYKRMGVNPTRWGAVIDRLAKHFSGHEEVIRGNMDILMKIYSTVPRMREGARIVLEVLREAGVKIGLVTHANVEWTYFKLDQLGLWDCFDLVKIVDENGHKKSVDWNEAIIGLDVDPEKCVFVGDNLAGDIRPGDDLGARTIYLPSPWLVYREGQIPDRTEVINRIFETLAALERLR